MSHARSSWNHWLGDNCDNRDSYSNCLMHVCVCVCVPRYKIRVKHDTLTYIEGISDLAQKLGRVFEFHEFQSEFAKFL